MIISKSHLCAGFLLIFTATVALSKIESKIDGNQGKPLPSTAAYESLLKKLEPLIKEQKFQAALTLAKEEAPKIQAPLDQARILVKIVQIETGLRDIDTAVTNLREKEWPKDDRAQTLLHIFYAYTLQQYARSYSWEISQRTKLAGLASNPSNQRRFALKELTGLEIHGEAIKSMAVIWPLREKLGTLSKNALNDFISPNTYPEGVRDSLRDSYSMLFVKLLNDSSGWSAEQSNDLFRLNLQALLKGKESQAIDFKDGKVHPLEKIAKILVDLKSWHEQSNKPDAALDVQLEMLKILHQRYTHQKDKELVRERLLELLSGSAKKTEWYSMGAATLAQFWIDTASTEAFVKARAIAKAGVEAFPTSLGATYCRDLIKMIEAPQFELQAMKLDSPNRRSLGLDYKNIKKVYFSAFKYDFKKFLESNQDYSHYPGHRDLAAVWKSRPSLSWAVDLPPTGDYNMHKNYVTPPPLEPGFYIIVAATQPHLGVRENIVRSTMVFLSDLVITQTSERGQTEFEIRHGQNGQLEKDVSLSIYRFVYSKKNVLEATLKTDSHGRATYKPNFKIYPYAQYAVLAESQKNLSFADFTSNDVSVDHRLTPKTVFFTDRSIYRPQQKIMWKIIAYRPDQEIGKFSVSDNSRQVVSLKDMNGQVVEKMTVTTDQFGAAWGEFLIPAGRTLGRWSLGTDHGSQVVRVEEYKRPTFEVQWKPQAKPLRLNHLAEVVGEARYYFGSPLTSGRVRYSVTRSVVFPWWCFWGYFGFQNQQSPQVISTAETKIENDGTFKIQFTPEAEDRDSKGAGKAEQATTDKSLQEIKFNYVVNAEVLDDGGETRTAQKTFPVGHQAVEAFLTLPSGFVIENSTFEVSLRRALMTGDPSPGVGTWRLVKLMEPALVQMPSENPTPRYLRSLVAKELRLPDDEKQARWNPNYNWQMLVRDWSEAQSVTKGSIETDQKGSAAIKLPKLSVGTYRLIYQTIDSFGVSVDAQTDFFVANEVYRPKLPGLFLVSQIQAKVGEVIDLWLPVGLSDQTIIFEVFQDGRSLERRVLNSSRDLPLIKWPIEESMRGGLAFSVRLLNDYQVIDLAHSVFVPWSNKEISIGFTSFRDKLRPGQDETWTIKLTGPDKEKVSQGSVQLLAYMYDRSLDQLAPPVLRNLMSIYPVRSLAPFSNTALGLAPAGVLMSNSYYSNAYLPPKEDFPIFLGNYGIGGPGRRGFGMLSQGFEKSKLSEASSIDLASDNSNEISGHEFRGQDNAQGFEAEGKKEIQNRPPGAPIGGANSIGEKTNLASSETGSPLRTNFSETAFFYPNLVSGQNGEIEIKFRVPEAVTSWTLWLQGLTRDLKVATASNQTETVKELLVRPYLPRFLREGDQAKFRFVLNNTSGKAIAGQLRVELLEEDAQTDAAKRFKVNSEKLTKPFRVEAGKSFTYEVEVKTPVGLGNLVVRAVATAGNLTDGEQRSLPILPGRFHLAQSKFVSLKEKETKTIAFSELKTTTDASLINEKMTLQIDAQLFYSVLSALPYLVTTPYECVEQTLNRFISTGIMTSLFGRFPAIEKMAKDLSARKTQFERFDAADANRKMALEETPWLTQAKGGREASENLVNVLDSKIATQVRIESISKLEKAQSSLGAFPWFAGGAPSPYMTLYVVYGFSKALEFGVEVPKPIVQKAWSYLHRHYLDQEVRQCLKLDTCWEFVTFLNYVISNYPDKDWGQKIFTDEERIAMLDFSFKHWKEHSPYLKGYLTLTLMRSHRQKEALLVWESVMDSAKFSAEEGTHWSRESRSWLWYNDTIETHAFALRTLMELGSDNTKRDGLVQWLFLNKKMNHWQSTKATAEVIYSLAHYLSKTNQLGVREAVSVRFGSENPIPMEFLPEKYTGQKNQIVFEGPKVTSALMPITVQKTTSGLMFASASGLMFASAQWQFSTEKNPVAAVGDFLSVERKYFLRDHSRKEVVLRPVTDGQEIQVGDEIEVQLSLKSKHPVDYVHLRDPRGAGFEPVSTTSKHKWDLGLSWYEEIRDSGTNFFFERLPQGEYTFKYRIRASTAGEFKVSPATLQPMYATEFSAYSAGQRIRIASEN